MFYVPYLGSLSNGFIALDLVQDFIYRKNHCIPITFTDDHRVILS